MIDLANAKGLRIYTDFLEYIGNYTITVTATMERYPEKSVSFEVPIFLEEPNANVPTAVTFAPILETDVGEPFVLEPGEEWSLALVATDVDEDLAEINVDFSGNSGDFLAFDYD